MVGDTRSVSLSTLRIPGSLGSAPVAVVLSRSVDTWRFVRIALRTEVLEEDAAYAGDLVLSERTGERRVINGVLVCISSDRRRQSPCRPDGTP